MHVVIRKNKMVILQQVDILTAGVQPWNTHICAAHGNRFAYAATLAVYIYEYSTPTETFKLHSIMCEHTKTITAITWHPSNSNIIASCSSEEYIVVWNIRERKVEAKLDSVRAPIANIEWRRGVAKDTLSFMCTRGRLLCWEVNNSKDAIVVHKNNDSFVCDVCVFKWNVKDANKVCYGHTDGSISIYDGKKLHVHVLSTVTSSASFVEDNVLSLEWDPLSSDYVLVSSQRGGIRLIDTSSQTVITQFKLPKSGMRVSKVCWVSSAPGMFISGDSKSGMLRVWSVAQDTPVANVLLKEKGFQSLFVMESQYTKRLNRLSSESSCRRVVSESTALPPVSVVTAFQDGGLGVYHLKRHKWMFQREKRHTETIFACEFHPTDPNILATCSFDNSIKIWDIRTMTPIHTSPGNLSVVYSLSWKRCVPYKIYGATQKHGAVLWDVESGTVVEKYNDHNSKSVYACCCSPQDDDYFASVGADAHCIVNISGKQKHTHMVFDHMLRRQQQQQQAQWANVGTNNSGCSGCSGSGCSGSSCSTNNDNRYRYRLWGAIDFNQNSVWGVLQLTSFNSNFFGF